MADTNFNYYWRQYLKGGIGPEKGIAALAILEKRFKLGASIRLTEDELSEVEARVDALSAKYDLDTEPGEQGSEAEVVASDEDKQEADALLLLLKSKCGPMFEHMTKESWGRLEADLDTVDTLKRAQSGREAEDQQSVGVTSVDSAQTAAATSSNNGTETSSFALKRSRAATEDDEESTKRLKE